MLNYEAQLNELLKNNKIRKKDLFNLLNDFNLSISKEKIDKLFESPSLSKQEILDLFKAEQKIAAKQKINKFWNRLRAIRVNKLFIFKIGVLGIFCISFVMAVINILQVLQESNSFLHALASSISIIGFNLICFESIIFVVITKKAENIRQLFIKTMSVLFFSVMFILLTSYIFMSITKAQFDRYQIYLYDKKEKNNEDLSYVQDDTKKQENTFEKELNNRTARRDLTQNAWESIEDKNSNQARTLEKTLNALNGEIVYYTNLLTKIRNDRKASIIENKPKGKKIPTMFEFINDHIIKGKLNVSLIEFFLIIAPSLFYDIISSTSLAIVFFLNEQKKKVIIP
jgi:hypothetical protein